MAITSAVITLSKRSQTNGVRIISCLYYCFCSPEPLIDSFHQAGTRPVVLYPVSGSGVAELKLRSKGIRLPKYFDISTISCKIIGIILSGSSGLCLGKEGPYIHIAAGIGNTVGDLFQLCGSQAELLYNAGAAAGFCVAFGAPISGLIFVLEELPYVLSAFLEA